MAAAGKARVARSDGIDSGRNTRRTRVAQLRQAIAEAVVGGGREGGREAKGESWWLAGWTWPDAREQRKTSEKLPVAVQVIGGVAVQHVITLE